MCEILLSGSSAAAGPENHPNMSMHHLEPIWRQSGEGLRGAKRTAGSVVDGLQVEGVVEEGVERAAATGLASPPLAHAAATEARLMRGTAEGGGPTAPLTPHRGDMLMSGRLTCAALPRAAPGAPTGRSASAALWSPASPEPPAGRSA